MLTVWMLTVWVRSWRCLTAWDVIGSEEYRRLPTISTCYGLQQPGIIFACGFDADEDIGVTKLHAEVQSGSQFGADGNVNDGRRDESGRSANTQIPNSIYDPAKVNIRKPGAAFRD
jgi:hypothetical protein